MQIRKQPGEDEVAGVVGACRADVEADVGVGAD
jgi:hypothetical protein